MNTINEMIETVAGLEWMTSVSVPVYSVLLIAALIALITALGLKKWGLRSLGYAVPVCALLSLVFVATTSYVAGRDDASVPDQSSLTREARVYLNSIVDAQITHFTQFNKWAGYPDNKDIFKMLGWKPGPNAHYAYYCGNDFIVPKKSKFQFNYPDPAVDWPYGLYPEVTVSDFTCMAIGNNDPDAYPDVWMINKFKRPTHVIDDATNTVLVDIVSEPFDANHFYTSGAGKSKKPRVNHVYIEINMPAFRLDLHVDGRRLKSYPIAIGMRGFKTPLRNFTIERIEWNPWWIPPNAAWCKKKEKDEEGNVIKITGCKPVSPGPWNPLGPVKMIMQSAILIHGTNKPRSIGSAASHSCIRVQSDNASDLAWKLMVFTGTKQPLVKQELYRDKSRKTYRISLLNPVQVATVYNRVEILDGSLLVNTDPYKWEPMYPDDIKVKLTEYGLTMSALGRDEATGVIRPSTEGALKFSIKAGAFKVNE